MEQQTSNKSLVLRLTESALMIATNVAVQIGAPIVAQPSAMPFFLGNQFPISAAVQMRPKAMEKNTKAVRQMRYRIGLFTNPNTA